MVPLTLEHDVLSTTEMNPAGERWISKSADASPSRYMPLCKFDLRLHGELDRVERLERNWDAQGACPINSAIIDAARNLISSLPPTVKHQRAPVPAVVPMRKGNLQFEWHDGPRTLELEIETRSTVHYLKWHPEAGIEEEDVCPVDDTETLTALIQWFVEG